MNNNSVEIYHMIEGAKKAKGLTVIIDVFRAFSLECFMYDLGAALIRPTATIEETYAWREKNPSVLLVGERGGKMCEGFDFGNSPSAALKKELAGKTVIHTTSAGTQGIVNATGADEIITGSLVNAAAVARYIRAKDPEDVSLVAMGNSGIRPAQEDELCAEYIKSMVMGDPLPDIDERIADLRFRGGEHFFNPDTQEIFPEPDFHLCVRRDIFDFVIQVSRDENGFVTKTAKV